MRTITFGLSSAAAIALTGFANAAVVTDDKGGDEAIAFEVEPNDTIAEGLANGPFMVFPVPGESVLIDGVLTPGDVDWYAFEVEGPAILVGAIFSLSDPSIDDSQLQVVTPGGTVLAINDDGGLSRMSAIQVDLPSAGTYLVGVSGYDDADLLGGATGFEAPFDGLSLSGPHLEDFVYKLSLSANVVPEPASLALLALGGLALARRRR